MRLKKLAAAVTTATLFAVIPVSTADAWGRHHRCSHAHVTRKSTVNDWQAFTTHKIRVSESGCTKVWAIGSRIHSKVVWAAKPFIQLPSTIPVPVEDVTLEQGPELTKVFRDGDGVYALKYSFTVKHCALKLPFCQHLDYNFYVKVNTTQICAAFGGDSCDDPLYW